ncbi:ISL3 family transposase [Methanobrevibacter smithii]|uniref:ISL3 family transposase n=1 Tax=Methanobrevibacter smithii TaxID=2173 RepID=UPI00384E03E0|nr:ISL3 family transposase [Erysipelotrichaceae bacterium]
MDTNIRNKFITNILNVDDKDIDSLDCIDDSNGNLTLTIKLLRKESDVCPACDKPGRIHGYNTKKLNHSIFANRKCIIIFKQRRYKCVDCDLTFSESNPFAKRNGKITHETKINVLKDLKRTNVTYNQVAGRYNITATEVQRIFDKHVNIEPHALPEALSIDEHYFPNSDYDGLYMFIMMDFRTGELIDIYPDRKKSYLISKFSAIKNRTYNDKTHTSELSRVKYISMDLNDYYRQVCKLYFPNAIICADEFHVIKNLNDYFDNVRKRCRRNCDSDLYIYLLTKFECVLSVDADLDNIGKYNRKLGRYINYRGIRELIFEAFPDIRIAYELKEDYISFNRTATLNNAEIELEKLIEAFKNCSIKEYKAFSSLLINWEKEIVNSFIVIEGKRINNSFIESRNRQIGSLIYNANGLSNFKRTRNRIMYCINKNDTYSI